MLIRSGSGIRCLLLPVDVSDAVMAIQSAAKHEQQIRQTIQEMPTFQRDLRFGGEGDQAPFGPAAHACSARAAGQDKFLQWCEWFVFRIKPMFKLGDVLCVDRVMAGNGKFAADVEQAMLDKRQLFVHRRWQRFIQKQTEHAIEFIDVAHSFYPRAGLGDARAVRQARSAVVAGTCINFRQSVSHIFKSCRAKRRVGIGSWQGMLGKPHSGYLSSMHLTRTLR
jgi:hypothetical protein